MRTPQDLPHPRAAALRPGRAKWWIVAGVVVLVILLASLKSVATLYTDSLWFGSVGLHRVWSTLLAVKIGLFASFGAVFFVLVWANLAICDRLAQRSPAPEPEDELVRRYQRAVRPYTGRVHAGVALVLALIGASGTVGQWNNWILFTHATSFGVKDPQFGMDIGFFVFRLPFLQFLVDWTLVALVVVLAVTAVFHYLNGGIRLQRAPPRVRPSVKAHLSVILAMIALVKAGGYILQRFQLDMSTNGYVEGAGYADVHARLPALEVLFFISLFAAAILLYNIRRQGWTLPVLAIGLWAFVALVIGVIYPAVLQALTVNPAQSHLELPYIQRNITATRAAYGLTHVKTSTFAGSTAKGTAVPTSTVAASLKSLGNIRLWDPDPRITQRTFQKKQNIRSYYAFQSIGVDRYTVGGVMRPVVIGVRQINPTDLPATGWVNAHLQYTHGEGAVLAPANTATSDGNPTFGISGVPPQSARTYPKITHPQVYFGLNQPGYVVADTHQPELTYQRPKGAEVERSYAGSGGVTMGSWLTKAAFAVRLGDFNLLVSNLITPQSKMIFVRTVVEAARKAAPFLSFDSHPYAAVVNGHIDWILDGYTSTANYPYSQNADTQRVPPGSGLPSSYNYVRNSVKVVIDAYSGKMTFYAMDHDPILRAYEAAFPKMFTPATVMPPHLRSHLRYPENMFSVQAAVYGRYHITSPPQFYSAGNAWTLSPTTGAGSPQNTLQVTTVTNAQGQVIGGTYQPMSPIYQVLQEPGTMGQSFTITDAYVPAGQSSYILSAFIMGNADPGKNYETLHVYQTASGSSVNGPVLADAAIEQTTTVSKTISLLNQRGSQVLLGNVLMVPMGKVGMLYVRPLYVQSAGNPQPQLKRVIAVYGQTVAMKPTLAGAIDAVFGTNVFTTPSTGGTSTTTSGGTGPSSNAVAEAAKDIREANQKFAQADTALRNGTLGAFQTDLQAGIQLTQTAQALLGQTPTGSSGNSSGSAATGGSTSATTTATSTPTATTGTTGGSGHRSSRTRTGSSGGTTSTTKTSSPAAGSGGNGGAPGTSTGQRSSTTGTGGTGPSGATTTTVPGEA